MQHTTYIRSHEISTSVHAHGERLNLAESLINRYRIRSVLTRTRQADVYLSAGHPHGNAQRLRQLLQRCFVKRGPRG